MISLSRLMLFSFIVQYLPFHKSLNTVVGNSSVLDIDDDVRESASNRCTDWEIESIFLVDFMASIIGFRGSSFSTLKTAWRISIGISRMALDSLIFHTPETIFPQLLTDLRNSDSCPSSSAQSVFSI